MPPIPVLVLLAIVAVFLYLCVGSVVAVLVLRYLFDDKDHSGIRTLAKGEPSIKGDAWVGFGWFVGLWPIVLALLAVWGTMFGLVFVLLAGPVFVCKKIGTYIARATYKELPSDAS